MKYRSLVSLRSIAAKARLSRSRVVIRLGSEALAKKPAKSAEDRS